MSQLPWREQLNRELRSRSLPAAYRRRLLEELLEHQFDMEVSDMSMDVLAPATLEKRLGDPRVIAKAAAEVYRRNFVQRQPLLCFVAGPLLGFPAAVVCVMALGIPLVGWILGIFGLEMDSFADDPIAANRAFHAFAWALRLVPFAFAAAFFVFLARRSKQDYRWSLVAVLLITLLAASFHAQVADKIGTAKGNFSVGFSFPMTAPIAYVQVAAPLAIALYAFLRRKDAESTQFAR
jgi:hypothetical protein